MRSMTGYATGLHRMEEASVAIEIKTVNHRYLDLHVRLPRDLSPLESEIQKIVRKSLRRGRIDIHVSVDSPQQDKLQVDVQAARGYIDASRALSREFDLGQEMDLKTLMSLPGVLQTRDRTVAATPPDPEKSRLVLEAVQSVLKELLDMREREGAAIQRDLSERLTLIHRQVELIRAAATDVAVEYRRKLTERLEQVLPGDGLDPQRLAQEIALMAERGDISEEITRLQSHLEQFQDWMTSSSEDGQVGKRMDFLLQEMQRETNTILSKSGKLEITQSGIQVKAEIEKLREQVQNVE